MTWKKEESHSSIVHSEYLIAAIIILFIIGLFIKQPILYIVMGIFIAYFMIHYRYKYVIDRRFNFKNDPVKIKLSQGEVSVLVLEFSNQSLFPIINGVLKFEIRDSIYPLKHKTIEHRSWNEFIIPLSVSQKGKTTIEIPIKAAKRGTSYIQNIKFTFPSLFNFEPLTLTYLPVFQTEIIVYPKLLPVLDTKSTLQMIPGSFVNQLSPYEELQSSVGTRNYIYSDPFNRINWKASAKANQLQTNLFDKVVDLSFTFMVNLDNQMKDHEGNMPQEIEQILSYTAYLCHHATKKGIPYNLYINVRKPGYIPYLELGEGDGNPHYGKALEMLARINNQAILLPFEQMIYHIGKQFIQPHTIVIIGEISNHTAQTIKSWQRKRNIVYHVEQEEDGAILKLWKKEVIQYAT